MTVLKVELPKKHHLQNFVTPSKRHTNVVLPPFRNDTANGYTYTQGGRHEKNIGGALWSDDDVTKAMTSLLLLFLAKILGGARAPPAPPVATPLLWHGHRLFNYPGNAKKIGIGSRVAELGPNFGQILNKIAISREPLVRFGWNFDCRVIFDLQGYLKSEIKALKSTVAEIMTGPRT